MPNRIIISHKRKTTVSISLKDKKIYWPSRIKESKNSLFNTVGNILFQGYNCALCKEPLRITPSTIWLHGLNLGGRNKNKMINGHLEKAACFTHTKTSDRHITIMANNVFGKEIIYIIWEYLLTMKLWYKIMGCYIFWWNPSFLL